MVQVFMDAKKPIKLTHIAMMVSLITVCSWLTIPTAVPFTMQTFAVFCALLLLGGKSGLTAVALYVLMGCIGMPVFSGFQGGIGHLFGPTGGYVIGFVFAAAVYLLFEPLFLKHGKLRLPVLIGGLFLCYLIGTVWFQTVWGMQGTTYSFKAVISVCVLPYIIPDLIKLALAYLISNRMRKVITNINPLQVL